MRKHLLLLAGLLPAFGCQMQAADNPLSESTKAMYESVKTNILKSADEMPDAGYAYKPIATVRTFGQLVAHVADGQYEFCSALTADKSKPPEVEKTMKTKTELVTALKTAFSYCDKAYEGMTDSDAVQTVDFFGKPYAKAAILAYNVAHTDEHYGNMATYLRMKGLVPPSSKK